jgi:hypothetical protein
MLDFTEETGGEFMMDEGMETLKLVIASVCTLLVTILGWYLRQQSEKRSKKLKLAFTLQRDDNNGSLWISDAEAFPSGKSLCWYNCGAVPFVFSSILLYHKSQKRGFIIKILSDGTPVAPLPPLSSHTYPLLNRDFNSIVRYVDEKKIKKCSVFVIGADAKKYKGTLDLTWVFQDRSDLHLLMNSIFK